MLRAFDRRMRDFQDILVPKGHLLLQVLHHAAKTPDYGIDGWNSFVFQMKRVQYGKRRKAGVHRQGPADARDFEYHKVMGSVDSPSMEAPDIQGEAPKVEQISGADIAVLENVRGSLRDPSSAC